MTKMKMTLVLASLVLLSSMAAAAPVDYSTCCNATISGTLFTATYKAVASVHVPDPIAVHGINKPLGKLQIKCNKPCTSTGTDTTSFSVTISQTMPGSGSKTVTATLSGTFIMKNGTVIVTWSGPVAIHAGGFTTIYTPLPAGGVCKGTCNLQLKVDISQVPGTVFVPEPSAELLLGLGSLGFMGLAVLSRRMISV